MDFEFKRLDFNDMFLLRKYGEEIFELAERNNSNSKSIIDVNINDEELKRLIKSIPTSIGEEIEKNIDEDMPVTLNLLDKMLSNKLVSFMIPNFISNKAEKKIVEAKDNCENNNSIELYNTIMTNIESIRFKLEEEYSNTETIVSSLESSKAELIEICRYFDLVIETGLKDIENYQNSNVEDSMKQEKISLANNRILSLRNARASYQAFIQQKDMVAVNLFMYLMKVEDWLRVQYPTLSKGVEGAIEAKYINNKTKQLKDLIDTSNGVMLDSANSLKEASETNVKLLKAGSLDHDAMNRYLKTINEALAPIQALTDGRESDIKKLISNIEKIETELSKNSQRIESICTSHAVPVIEEPKVLRLENKANHV